MASGYSTLLGTGASLGGEIFPEARLLHRGQVVDPGVPTVSEEDRQLSRS